MPAKYLTLAAQLRRMCTRLRRQGKAKLPGETELAERYGCSRQTVRHALSVLEEEGLIRRRHGSGTYLSGGGNSGSRIAVIVENTEEYLYPKLIRDIEAVCGPEGYTAEAFSTGNQVMAEREILSSLLRNPPAGIVMETAKSALPNPNWDLLSAAVQQEIPLVLLNAPVSLPISAVTVREDSEGGAILLVRYLIGKGRGRIGGIFRSDDLRGQERYYGYISELIKNGCPVDEGAVVWYDTGARRELLAGSDSWLEKYVETHLSGLDAVLCHNDEIAFPLIRILLKSGLRVPEDIAVVSFDNSYYCPLGSVPITSLAQERYQTGTAAARALLEIINGKNARSLSLRWALRKRASG